MKNSFFLLLSLTFITALLFTSCSQEPLKAGFVASLSGRQSEMGIEELNGVKMAIQDINNNGGVNGRMIELQSRDDENTRETARTVVSELINEGVEVIFGHATSTMTMHTIDLINDAEVIMISPSTSTDLVSNIDDYFFRLVPSSAEEARQMGDYAYNILGKRNMSSVADLANHVYTVSWIENTIGQFSAYGGDTPETISFNSKEDKPYLEIAKELLQPNPDIIAIAAGPIDSALICQQIRKLNKDVTIMSSGWAKGPDFLENGGSAVEGAILSEIFDPNSKEESFVDFKERFFNEFAYYPSFPGTHAYNSVFFFKKGYESKTAEQSLKDSLNNITSLKGVQNSFEFNGFGDPTSKRYILEVIDGKFVLIED